MPFLDPVKPGQVLAAFCLLFLGDTGSQICVLPPNPAEAGRLPVRAHWPSAELTLITLRGAPSEPATECGVWAGEVGGAPEAPIAS